ncbi:beta strand repeat-containing protein, partial [Flavobacterium sp.]|uniref:beta strand repeat-containing protein n=1 Tax=Flavobacterium sp. TaxID=239 RepID=UPI002B4B7EAC
MKLNYNLLIVFLTLICFGTNVYAQPANNTCATAEPITVGVGTCSSILYTNVGATTAGNPATPACWSPNSMSHTVWFSFVATSVSIELSTNFSGTLANTQIAVFSGLCGGLTQIACQEDVNTAGGLLHTNVIVHGLTIGNTYYVAVDGNGNTTGTFGICAQQAMPLAPPAPTQDCATAQFLCNTSNIVIGDGTGGPGVTDEPGSCFLGAERASWWYSFTAATTGTLAFTITPNTAIDYDFAVFNTTAGCLGTEVACNWSGTIGTTGLGCAGAQCEATITVTAGQTYSILIDRFTASSSSGFTLNFAGTTATFASPNPTFTATTVCAGTATQFTNTTSGSNTYSWNFGDGFTSNLEDPTHTYAVAGTYNVTLLVTTVPGGCQNSIIQPVTVNPQPNAGADGATTICDSNLAVINLFGLITGEQAGGTWTQTSGSGGTFNAGAGTFTPAAGATSSTFTYTLTGTAPCVNDASVATITINPQPNAGTDGGTIVCDSSLTAINLFGLITGEQAGGTWTRTSGSGGTFNAGAGTFTPAAGATTSSFTYTLTGTAPCIDDASVATITINAQPNAGTDGNTTICDSSVTTINLFGLITGEQVGGTWTQTSGSGGTFNAGAGTFTPAVGATSSTFTYALSGTAPCINDTSIASITVNPQPIAGTDGGTTVCDSSLTTIDLFNLITGEQAGGTWTRTTGLGGTFNAGAGTYTPAVGATSSTFTYTLTGIAPCINDSSIATITINPQPNAGTDGGTTVCDSNVATINLFSLITGEQTGGTWTQASGSGGTFNAGAGTYTPAAGATSSTFIYTLTGTAPCIDDISIASITINPQPNAGADGDTTICDSSLAAINLFGLITGEQTGGTWTRTSGSGGTFNAGTGAYTPAAGAISSTFAYTLTGIAPCINDVSVATITINAQPNAGTDGGTTVCDSSSATINLFGLIVGEQGGGTWTQTSGSGGIFNAGTGTFTPASGATSSTFTYALTGTAPCINDTSVATITINAQPNAGVDGDTAVCDSSLTTIDLFNLITGEQSGGTWTRTSGSGGTFNAGAGTFTPSTGATSSTFSYMVAGTLPCANDTSVVTITINAQPNAGTDGAVTFCDSSGPAIHVADLITGEDSGGTWTQTSGPIGNFNPMSAIFTPPSGASSATFVYTVTGTAPCIDDSSVATITIIEQPNAGTDGGTTICDSNVATINLFTLITGGQSGGTWTQSSGSGGTFNAGAGTFTPAVGATTSTFTYTLAGIAPCIDDTSVATITINPQPNAGTDGGTTVCDSSLTAINLFGLISGEQAGGIWTRTSGSGGTFNAGAGTYTPSAGATSSTFAYTLAGTVPCIDDSSVATITINPQPDAGLDGNTTVCDSSLAVINLFDLITGEQTGGTWTQTSGSGGTFNAGAGTYTPSSDATSSTFAYTLTGMAPCIDDTSVATITINAQPEAGADGNIIICDSSLVTIDLFSLITGEQSGGTWTQTSGLGGIFNAVAGTFTPSSGATSSTFVYTLIGTSPCIDDSSVATITINPQPDAGVDGNTTVCDSSLTTIDLFSLITGEQAGGTWTQTSGSGGTFNASAGTYTPVAGAISSTFTYTLIGTAPCINDTSVATITINAQPSAGTDGNTTVCDMSVVVIDLFNLIAGEQANGVWTRTTGSGGTFNATAGTFTPAAGTTSSIFAYTLTGTAPCLDDTSLATVNINPGITPTFDAVSPICTGATLLALPTTSNNGYTGTWSPALNNTATTTYTFTPSVGQCATTTTMTITVNPLPTANTPTPLEVCDPNSDGFSAFNLESASNEIGGGSVPAGVTI